MCKLSLMFSIFLITSCAHMAYQEANHQKGIIQIGQGPWEWARRINARKKMSRYCGPTMQPKMVTESMKQDLVLFPAARGGVLPINARYSYLEFVCVKEEPPYEPKEEPEVKQ